MNTTTVILMALVLCAGAAHAAAEGPSISVTNERKGATRRVEIVIQDPIVQGEIPSGSALPEAAPLTAPDGGQIQGSMVAGGKFYAVTEKRLIGVGDKIAGHTVTQVTLDHVTISKNARTYELDVTTGEWSFAAASVAE